MINNPSPKYYYLIKIYVDLISYDFEFNSLEDYRSEKLEKYDIYSGYHFIFENGLVCSQVSNPENIR